MSYYDTYEMDQQIEALRVDAGVAWDPELIEICTRALEGDKAARKVCAQIIAYNAARLEDDGDGQ